MARLAEQHQPGGWKYVHDPYEVQCAWPEDCLVQWGSQGVVICRKEQNYQTAFFESFPRDPNTFIRGEGKTIAEAEAHAFRQYEKFQACPGHEFEKRGYRNGAGICKLCGMFGSKVFDPWEGCAVCGILTYYTWDGDKVYCEKHMPPSQLRTFHELLKQMAKEERDAQANAQGANICEVLPGGPEGVGDRGVQRPEG